ncbi:AAA family ATPase [Streptomyces cellulosae]
MDAATGVPFVRGPWRDDSKVTLDTGFPPPTAAAHNLDGVRRAIETALPATGPARREAVARELDAFLNRMRKGDIVLSTDGFETYVGVVDGPAVHGAERLERPVDWRNLNKPLDFLKDLPSGLSSVVQDADSQALEPTEYAETVLALIGDMPRTASLPTGPAVLPDATSELAEALLMPDTTWLQDCVELLRATPQLIFHGPPGTGKTYTALALARHLAPSPAIWPAPPAPRTYASSSSTPPIPTRTSSRASARVRAAARTATRAAGLPTTWSGARCASSPTRRNGALPRCSSWSSTR